MLILVVESALFVASLADAPVSDPIWYAAVSHDIAIDPDAVFSGRETHPFVMRVGLTVPLALLFRLAGTSPLVTAIPMICAMLLVLVVGFCTALTLRSRLLVLLLLGTSAPLLRHATELGVDLPCGALLALSVLCLHRRDHHPRRWIAGALVSWFAAFLVKETALWLLPVWIYAVAIDAGGHGRRWLVRAYAPGVVLGLVLAVAYLAWCNSVWGTPFARFVGIDSLHHEWSVTGQSAGVWLERMTWGPLVYYGAVLKGALLGVAAAPFLLRGRDRLWTVAALTLIGMHWFGSSSLTGYSPLPLIERMGLLALPCGLIAAGLAFDHVFSRTERSTRIALALFVAITIVMPFTVSLARALRRGHPETDTFLAVRDELRKTPGPMILICGAPACPDVAAYYFGFAIPPDLTIHTPDRLTPASCPAGVRVRAIVNTRRSARLRPVGGDFSTAIEAAQLPVLSSRRHVVLYDVRDCAQLVR